MFSEFAWKNLQEMVPPHLFTILFTLVPEKYFVKLQHTKIS